MAKCECLFDLGALCGSSNCFMMQTVLLGRGAGPPGPMTFPPLFVSLTQSPARIPPHVRFCFTVTAPAFPSLLALRTIGGLILFPLTLPPCLSEIARNGPSSCMSYTKHLSTLLDVFPSPICIVIAQSFQGVDECHLPGDTDKRTILVSLPPGISSNKTRLKYSK